MAAVGSAQADENRDVSSNADELEWVQLHDQLQRAHHKEGMREKLIRKTKDNPFVPIGALATAGVLSYGLWTMKTGNRQMSQYMMRMRIVAQGFTVAAIVVGFSLAARQK